MLPDALALRELNSFGLVIDTVIFHTDEMGAPCS